MNFSLRNSVFQNKSVRILLSSIMMGIKLQTREKDVPNLDRKNCTTRTLENTRDRQE